jgi:hypothetical protein
MVVMVEGFQYSEEAPEDWGDITAQKGCILMEVVVEMVAVWECICAQKDPFQEDRLAEVVA